MKCKVKSTLKKRKKILRGRDEKKNQSPKTRHFKNVAFPFNESNQFRLAKNAALHKRFYENYLELAVSF